MSDQDPFATTNTPPNTPQQQETLVTPPSDPFSDKLKGIVNEAGEPKYESVEKALEALQHSQQFIETLKAEKAAEEQRRIQAEEQVNKMASIEDLVKRVSPPPQEPAPAPTSVTSVLNEEKVQELVQQTLMQRDQQSQQDKNLATVISELSTKFGDKASALIKQRAEELGSTPESLKDLAKSNPKMALALLVGNKAPTSPAPSQSSITLPTNPTGQNEPPRYEKGVTRGGLTNKELVERLQASKEYTNKRLGVTS